MRNKPAIFVLCIILCFCNTVASNSNWYDEENLDSGNECFDNNNTSFSPPPANDLCSGAIELILDCGTQIELTPDPEATPDFEATGNCIFPSEPAQWYTFTTPDPIPYSNILVNNVGAAELFSTTTDCSGLVFEECGLFLNVEPATTYYLLTKGLVEIKLPVSNYATCDDPLPYLNTNESPVNLSADNNCEEPNSSVVCGGEHVVWYSYTVGCAEADILIEVSAYETYPNINADEVSITVLYDDCMTLASDYDANGLGYVCSAMVGGESIFLENVPAGTNLVIGFGSSGNDTGFFSINFTDFNDNPEVTNDICNDAISLVDGINLDLTNECATNTGLPFDQIVIGCVFQSEATVWYEYDPGSTPQDIEISVLSTGISNPAIAAYYECVGPYIATTCQSTLELFCIDTLIFIEVASSQMDIGTFDLEITKTPSVSALEYEIIAEGICSGEETNITINILSGELVDIAVYDVPSATISGIDDHFFWGVNTATINDVLNNNSDMPANATYSVVITPSGTSCPPEPFDISIYVNPKFYLNYTAVDECLPHTLVLNANDIIYGGSQPYDTYTWYWEGTVIGMASELSYDLVEAGSIILEIVDDFGCAWSSEIDVDIMESTTPTFDFPLEYCRSDQDIISFPSTSLEWIDGVWNISSFDLASVADGFYEIVFTPNSLECTESVTYTIEIFTGDVLDFDLPTSICSDGNEYVFPIEDLNGIVGTWELPSVDASVETGTQTNIFTPSSEGCYALYEYTFVIEDEIGLTFAHPDMLCRSDEPFVLSNMSEEGFEGTWDISVIDPSLVVGNNFTAIWDPLPGQSPCIKSNTIDVQIVDVISPDFDLPIELCTSDTIYTFPVSDNQSIIGSWSVTSINPNTENGIIQSTFTPDEFCTESYTWEIAIVQPLIPEFSLDTELCALDDTFMLPTISDNGIEGTWTISTIDPSSSSGGQITTEFHASTDFCVEAIQLIFEVTEAQTPEFDLPNRLCWSDTDLLLPTNSLNGIEGSWEPSVIAIQANVGATISSIFSPSDGSCSNEQMQSFEIIPSYEVELIGTDPSSCIIEDGLIQMVTSETEELEYSIDEGATWQTSPLFSALSSGEYSILVRSNSLPACELSLETFLNSTDGPIINGVSSIDILSCIVDNGSIVIDAEGDDLEYSIDGGITWQSQSEFNNLGAGDYTIRIRKAASDCVEEVSASIIDFPQTEIVIVNTQDITDCILDNGQIEIIAEGAALEYSIDNGVSWSLDNIFDNLPSGEFEIIVQSTEGEDCSDSDLVELLSPETPNIIELNLQNPTICNTTIGRLEIEATGTNLEYSIDGGMTWQNSNVFNDLISDEYHVIVRDSERINCFDEEITSINLDNESLIESTFIITPPTSCEGEDARIEVINSTPDLEYSIDEGMTWQGANTFDNLLAGNYTLITRKISIPDCLIEQFIVIPNTDCPCGDLTVMFSTDNIDCSGENSAIVELISIQGMNNPSIDIEWQNGETGMSIEGVGEGWQIVTILYDEECIWIESIWVDVVEPIQFDWNVKDVDCPEINNGEIEIVNVTGGSGTYEYSLDGFNYQTENIFTELNDDTYEVYVRDDKDCLTNDVIEVLELEKIEIDLPEIVSIAKGESIILDPGIDEVRIDSFIWSPKVGVLNPGDLMIEVSPKESTTYTLEIYFGECFGSREITIISVTVEVIDEEEVHVGNVFSPDGDGINDVIYIQGVPNSAIVVNDFSIYDRWGNKVFYKSLPGFNNKADGWDGLFGGKMASSGVYIYMINYVQNEKSQIKVGTITLFN